MAGQLSDDGTMDTVIRCSECGAEQRYNYDGSARDEQDNEDRLADFRAHLPLESESQLQARVDEQCYDEFVDWCIEDFNDSHECPNPVCEICGEPAGAGGALCPVHLREAGIE